MGSALARKLTAAGGRWLLGLGIASAVIVLTLAGAFAPLDRALQEQRFRILDRPATGNLVVVQIDARSLRELDVWPWPRSYHAQLLERLIDAGASEIALDIDFSARSTPAGDLRLAEALDRAGKRVILPVFRQTASPEAADTTLFETSPHDRFGRSAQTGNVNVYPDGDGLVRRASPIQPDGAQFVPTMFALLAGPLYIEARNFLIDFGIDPSTLPRLSYVDVLRGDFSPDLIRGRKVIVGATAAELGDDVAVPLYQSMPGPVLQAMAYESLVQNRALYPLGVLLAALGTLFLAFALNRYFFPLAWYRAATLAVVVIGAIEGSAILLQSQAPVVIATAPWIVTVVVSFVAALSRKIERQGQQILQQRQALATRRALLDRMVKDGFDGIVITDGAGRIEICNQAAAEMLGRTSEDVVGLNLESVLPGFYGLAAESDQLELQQRTSHARPRDWIIARPDGGAIEVELVIGRTTLAPRDRSALEQAFYSFTFRDITERKWMQEAERRAAEQAVAANRAKTEFLANMSHELRTPLNAIIGFSEVIASEMLGPAQPPQYVDYAKDINDSGKHLLSVINDVLDVSKIELGKLDPNIDNFSLDELLQSCVKITQGWEMYGKRTFSTEFPDERLSICGDERMIKQAVINLLSNAFKYSEEGDSVTLKVVVADRSVIISVTDTGIGIAPDNLPNLTKPFYQVDGALARKFEGTGLGLYLVSSFARLHKGWLDIESELGIGTTVSLHLPESLTDAAGKEDAGAAQSSHAA